MSVGVESLTRRWEYVSIFALAATALVGVQLLPPRLSIAIALAVIGTVVVLAKPWTGVTFLVLYLPFNNLLSQTLGAGTLATGIGAAKDGVLALLAIAAIGRRRTVPRLLVPLVVFLVIGMLGFAYASSLSAGLYGWRNDFEPAILLLAVPAALTPAMAQRMTTLIVAVTQVAAIITFVTWRKGLAWLLTLGVWPPDPAKPAYGFFSAGSTRPRAFSPLAAPNELAAYMDVVLAVIWTRRDWSVRRRLLLSLLPAGAVYLSRSRSGLLGVVLLACFLTMRAAKRTHMRLGFGLASLFGIGFVAMLLVYLNRGGIAGIGNPSTAGHLVSVQSGLANAITHPLGFGLGDVGPRAQLTSSSPVLVESYWLLLALESGILALAAYLFLLGRATTLCIRGGDKSILGVAVVAAVLVSQLVLPTMQDGPVSFTFWLVVGIALVSISGDQVRPQPSSAERGNAQRGNAPKMPRGLLRPASARRIDPADSVDAPSH